MAQRHNWKSSTSSYMETVSNGNGVKGKQVGTIIEKERNGVGRKQTIFQFFRLLLIGRLFMSSLFSVSLSLSLFFPLVYIKCIRVGAQTSPIFFEKERTASTYLTNQYTGELMCMCTRTLAHIGFIYPSCCHRHFG